MAALVAASGDTRSGLGSGRASILARGGARPRGPGRGSGRRLGGMARDDHDDYTQRLEQYPESGEPHVFVNLPDGEAQLALGSPDGHRLVVQWRDPDGHGWTKPETVYEDSKLRAIENTVRYSGGTVGIVETYGRTPTRKATTTTLCTSPSCAGTWCATRPRRTPPKRR